MLIFGYGPRKPRDLGPAAPARCPSCGNRVEYVLLQQRSWVTLFFVPLIPASTHYLLVCPLCRHTVGLDAHQGRLAVGMASATADHRAGRLDDATYEAQVDAFWQALGATRDVADDAGPSSGDEASWLGGSPMARPGEPSATPHPSQGPPPPDPASRRPDPEPGWYPDPFDEADERYWDGHRWTQGTKPPRP